MGAEISQVKSIFLEAVEQHTPDQWDAFVRQACHGDGELERLVRVLLQAHLGDDSLFDSPDEDDPHALDSSPRERPGVRIGPYTLLASVFKIATAAGLQPAHLLATRFIWSWR